MKPTIKTKFLILAIFVCLLAILSLGYTIGHRKGVNASTGLIQTKNRQILSYQETINGNTAYISQVEQEIKSLRQAKKDGDVRNEELRKLNMKQVNEISRIKLRIDTLLTEISHNGQIVSIDTSNNGNCGQDHTQSTPIVDNMRQNAILLPFTFEKKDQWLFFDGTFSDKGKLDSIHLKLDFNADLIAGIDKSSKKNTALLITDCPYIKAVTFTSIKLDLPKEKKYGIGIFIGYGVGLKDFKATPVVGFGFSYTPIRF